MSGDGVKLFFLQFYGQLVRVAPRIVSGLLLFWAFDIGGRIVYALILHAGSRTRITPSLIRLLARIARTTLVILGAITALGTMGVNVSALIAGLGLSSFALGFAFKDALSNFLAGIFILLYRPFRVGDQISITGFDGKVVEIDLRYTTLDAGDKKILVPNSNVFVNPVTIVGTEHKLETKSY